MNCNLSIGTRGKENRMQQCSNEAETRPLSLQKLYSTSPRPDLPPIFPQYRFQSSSKRFKIIDIHQSHIHGYHVESLGLVFR